MAGDVLGTQRTIVDIQKYGPGLTNWTFLTETVGANAFTVGLGNVTNTFEKDPRSMEFVSLTPRREAPERIEVQLMTKLRAANFLEKLICQYAVRFRHSCGTPSDMLSYDRIDVLLQAMTTSYEYPDVVSALEPPDADRMLNVNVSAGPTMHEIILKVAGKSVALNLAGYTDVGLNDVFYCDAPQCACGIQSDGCNKVFAISDADTSPYATPYLFLSEDGGETWEVRTILGMTGDAVRGACMGDKVVVLGTTFGGIAYATADGDYNDWVTNVADFTDGDPLGIAVVDAATAYIFGTGGVVYKTEDGALTWTVELDPGELAITDLNCGAFLDASLGYAGGDTGALLKFDDGTWSVVADPTAGANILCMAIPPGRPKEMYLGTSTGRIYYTHDEAVTFTRYRWTGDGVGSVEDMAFAGALGTVLYFIQLSAGNDGRVMRDLSGGFGGPDVEAITTYAIPNNNGLFGIAACDPNEAHAVGNNASNGALVEKIS